MKLTKEVRRGENWVSFLPAFLIPFGGMLLVMLINGYCPFGSSAMLYSDSYHQYYPFFLAFRRALLSGDSLLYSWDIGMGVDFLGLIAYYLGSPLNLLSVFVSESHLLDYFCMLVPIKLGLAGLFFAVLLKELFRRDDFSIALFGSFYALCAWALGYQWNVMWLDTFALLPLVVLGEIRLLQDKKFALYTLTLALAVICNYYIGFFVCIFVFLSFFCFEICNPRGWKRFFCDLLRIALFSAIALGMTAFLTITAMTALQTTQSSVNQFPTTFRLNIASKNDLLGLLDAMRQVAGNMGGGIEPTFKEGLPNLYCGVGSIMLGVLFLLSWDVKWRDKLCCLFLLLFLNVSFIIRQLDYIWHGFHFPNMIPYRFSFLYSFVLLVMAYRAWMMRKKYDPLQVIVAGLITAAILCCCRDTMQTQTITILGESREVHLYIIYNVFFFVLYFLFLLIGSIKPRLREVAQEGQLHIQRKFRRRSRRVKRCACAAMALELAATLAAFGYYFPGTNVTDYPKGTDKSASMIRYMSEREEDTLFYRAETTHSQTLNDGALNGYSGISAFTSSANVHITEFMRALGYGAKNTYNRYCFEESSPVANLFLNLKYMIERDGRDRSSSCFEEVHHFGSTYLYRNTAYLPLGFLTESQLSQVDFLTGDCSFDFQNELFSAATGLSGDVWHVIPSEYREIYGTGAAVTEENENGFCQYDEAESGGYVIYSYVADQDGFACVRLDLPKRNTFYVSVNGTELYKEDISLSQMLAIQDVKEGDVIDIRILCKSGESGTATVNVAIMDNELFRLGYEILNTSTLTLTSFSNTLVEGTISCDRDGLLYTSIPQNGNWYAEVDGQPQETVLVGECMVALNLTQGTHTVRFVYRNDAFNLGVMISVSSAALFVLLILAVHFRKVRSVKKEQTIQAEEANEPAQAESEMPLFDPLDASLVERKEPFVLHNLDTAALHCEEEQGEKQIPSSAEQDPEQPQEDAPQTEE